MSCIRVKRVRVNGASVLFNILAWNRGELQLEAETMSEQCDTCGQDIAESGVIHEKNDAVQCAGCGSEFGAIDAMVKT